MNKKWSEGYCEICPKYWVDLSGRVYYKSVNIKPLKEFRKEHMKFVKIKGKEISVNSIMNFALRDDVHFLGSEVWDIYWWDYKDEDKKITFNETGFVPKSEYIALLKSKGVSNDLIYSEFLKPIVFHKSKEFPKIINGKLFYTSYHYWLTKSDKRKHLLNRYEKQLKEPKVKWQRKSRAKFKQSDLDALFE